jgi:hypothetical protein
MERDKKSVFKDRLPAEGVPLAFPFFWDWVGWRYHMHLLASEGARQCDRTPVAHCGKMVESGRR